MATIPFGAQSDTWMSRAPDSWRPGPVTARQLRQVTIGYGLLLVLGSLPLFAHAPANWVAMGVGLWFPGAGFLAVGGWTALLMPLFLLLFALAVFAWFGAGMLVAPPLVWLGAAALAGHLAGPAAWAPGVALAGVLVVAGAAARARRTARLRREGAVARRSRRQRLAAADAACIARAQAAPPVVAVGELTRDELASARYMLDRALQPVEDFNGYDILDNFQSAALRYQINWAAYGLSQIQSQYTPSFHGYLSLAQRNLIEKYLLPRVWTYWIYETIWGQLNFTNWDPAAKDNVMLTGYFEAQLAAYASTTGDLRYAEPGSLTFRLNRHLAWQHDTHTIRDSILMNMRRSPYVLYPCEPTWIYPSCNYRAITGLAAHDMAFGTNDLAEVGERFVRQCEKEFMGHNGETVVLKSAITGLVAPLFGTSDLSITPMLNIIDPEQARQRWALAAVNLHRIVIQRDGLPFLNLPNSGVDMGNYRPGGFRAFVAAHVIGAAQEFGDTELASAAQNTLDLSCGRTDTDGVVSYAASNCANLFAAWHRINRRDGIRRLYTTPPPAGVRSGPLLAEASYPDVLVAHALSDGRNLDLVLYSAQDGSTQTLGLSRLQPGALYDVSGRPDLRFRADDAGCANLKVAISGRTPIRVEPAAAA